jgi:hypothetical protein
MPGRSFDEANAFHRAMRTFIATKVGALFRPTAHQLNRLASELTGGRRSATGILTGVPAVTLTTVWAKSGESRTVAGYGIPHPEAGPSSRRISAAPSTRAGSTISRPTRKPQCRSRGDTWDAIARLAESGERDEIWAKGLEIYPGLRKYETRAGARHIVASVLIPFETALSLDGFARYVMDSAIAIWPSRPIDLAFVC